MKLSEVKEKIKQHAPEIITVSTTIVGTLGWILAGVYKQKLDNVEDLNKVVTEAFRRYSNENMIEVDPDLLREVRKDRASLVYWINDSGEDRFEIIDP